MDKNAFPLSEKDFEESLARIERGLATAQDADLIRWYVGEIYEVVEYYRKELKKEQASNEALQRSLSEALNSGSGVYIP